MLLGFRSIIMPEIDYLKVAGMLSFFASAMHIAIIFGGGDWYRFFGAGEAMAAMAEQGLLRPTLITLCVSFVLAIWGTYAWSAAGIFPELPLLKPVISLVTFVYLSRGVLGLLAPYVSNHPQIIQNSASFWLWSSLICLAFGLVHLKGVIDKWY